MADESGGERHSGFGRLLPWLAVVVGAVLSVWGLAKGTTAIAFVTLYGIATYHFVHRHWAEYQRLSDRLASREGHLAGVGLEMLVYLLFPFWPVAWVLMTLEKRRKLRQG